MDSAPMPPDLTRQVGHLGAAPKAKRACMECNRKKTKCDMASPVCLGCSKANSACIYPTDRKRRAVQPRIRRRRRSVREEIRNNFDTLFNLLGSKDKPGDPACGARESRCQNSPPGESDNDHSDPESNDYFALARSTSPPSVPDDDESSGANRARSVTSPQEVELPSDFIGDSDHLFGAENLIDVWQNTNDLSVINPTESSFASLEYFGCSNLQPNRTFAPTFGLSGGQGQLDPPTAWESSMGERSESADDFLGLDIPCTVVEELIDVYFSKVHPFVPILHRPRFTEKYLSGTSRPFKQDDPSALETSLLFHGMLALSARFSASTYFAGVAPVQRGDAFAEKAKAIYHESLRSIRSPTLEYLQGCTLLAVQLYASRPDSQGWLLIGMCVRMAYDLELDKIDIESDEDPHPLSPPEWTKKEELRRAWWSVWELDTFASAIACRPRTIDRTKIHVRLPVSDENWFSEIPMDSSTVDPNPLHAWHSLRDCPNQDERAWFLLINYLLIIAYDLVQERSPDRQAIEDIERAVTCYVLLLPPKFHLNASSSPLLFNSENFAKCNWIISTNIMLQGVRIFIKFISESSSKWTPSPSNNLLDPLAALSRFRARPVNYRPYSDQVFHAIGLWPPAFIPYNSPFIGCLILGPAAMNLRVAMVNERAKEKESKSSTMEVEMLKLALMHISRFWKLGSQLLDLANSKLLL